MSAGSTAIQADCTAEQHRLIKSCRRILRQLSLRAGQLTTSQMDHLERASSSLSASTSEEILAVGEELSAENIEDAVESGLDVLATMGAAAEERRKQLVEARKNMNSGARRVVESLETALAADDKAHAEARAAHEMCRQVKESRDARSRKLEDVDAAADSADGDDADTDAAAKKKPADDKKRSRSRSRRKRRRKSKGSRQTVETKLTSHTQLSIFYQHTKTNSS